MRVLLVNPTYPQTYWSMDRVLKMTGKRVLDSPLGLLTVAALLPGEWEIRMVELTIRDISAQEWDYFNILMITGMGVQSVSLLETVRQAKHRKKSVVVGGPWAFHCPEDALKAGADIVVKGELERVVPQLVEAIERGESGIIIEAQGRSDLKKSPAPRYDLLDLKDYAELEIQFSRGCPFRCEFCDVTLMFGRKVRTKSPEQILQELQIIYDLGWRRNVFFVDDNFIGNPLRAKALLRELIPWMEERGYPFSFTTQASVNLAKDSEMLDLMVRVGFYKVFLGIETPDKESLKLAGKSQNVTTDLDRACQTINEAGLQIIAGCIIGFDNERPGADQRLIDFAARNQIPEMHITLLQVGPGTDLWTRIAKEGRLCWTTYDENIGSQTALINFVPTRPVRQIVDEFINLYEVLYDPGFFLDRTFRHFSRMKRSPVKKAFSLPYRGELRAVLITVIRQGILYPTRWKFWKYFFLAMLKFERRRFDFFVTTCVMGEHYFEFRHTIKEKLQEAMSQRRRLLSILSAFPMKLSIDGKKPCDTL